MPGLLAKDRITARTDFNRWWIFPAALAINLSIGQAYAFSVFNLPLTRALGITHSTPDDWKLTTLGWIFTLAYVFLGLSASIAGRWQERVGPRTSGVVAALCWGGGFLLTALGVKLHRIELLYLGYGVLGGCGLGLGFITPISTLIRWFPDRRGMATGLAIMGFGGGALIAAPLSQMLMDRFASATSVGVAETLVVLGLGYLALMLTGAFMFRLPPPGWQPKGWHAPAAMVSSAARYVHVNDALRTPQFYLLWTMLLLNVTAGLGVLGQASAMIQEVFDGFGASAAALFVGLLSFFNMAGRFFWASLSDKIGRKLTYAIFFLLGPLLYAIVPWCGQIGGVVVFVGCVAVIMTMYGGGFATLPAYIADLFGAEFVGAIHGRVLTALAVAGVAGPVLVNYLREYQLAHGIAKAQAYNATMYIMAGLLVVGFLCNLALKPIDDRYFTRMGDSSDGRVTERRYGTAAIARAGSPERAMGSLSRPLSPGQPGRIT
jgi:MFS family permease